MVGRCYLCRGYGVQFTLDVDGDGVLTILQVIVQEEVHHLSVGKVHYLGVRRTIVRYADGTQCALTSRLVGLIVSHIITEVHIHTFCSALHSYLALGVQCHDSIVGVLTFMLGNHQSRILLGVTVIKVCRLLTCEVLVGVIGFVEPLIAYLAIERVLYEILHCLTGKGSLLRIRYILSPIRIYVGYGVWTILLL